MNHSKGLNMVHDKYYNLPENEEERGRAGRDIKIGGRYINNFPFSKIQSSEMCMARLVIGL